MSTIEGGMIWPSVPAALMVPAGDRRVVAALEHGGQRQQPHGHDGGADDAGGGRQQRADDAHRIAEPAAQAAEQQRHGIEQLLGDLRALQHDAHEDEQRHRDQHLVGHDAEDALREGAEDGEVEDTEASGRGGQTRG
jgi:hypothetical protein